VTSHDVTARRFRSPDPWGIAVSLAALGIFLALGFQGPLSRDLAIYAYGGQQVAEGVPPYVGIMNRAGPLAHLVPGVGALGARLVGIDDLFGMRLLMMGLSVLSVWAIYVLGRTLFGSRLAGLMTASSLVAFQGYVILATGGPREKTTMLLLLILALWACSGRRWLWAGVAVALGTLTWQPVFFIATAGVLVAIGALRGWAILRALGLYALGGAIPTAICVLGFWMSGALQDFLDGFVLVNYRYTADSAQSGLRRFLGYGMDQLYNGFGWSLWLVVAGMCLLLVAGVLRIRAFVRDHDPAAATVLAAGVALAVAGLWSLASFNGWADLVVALPLAALGLGAAAQFVLDHTPERLGTGVIAVVTAVTLVSAAAGSIVSRSDKLEEQRRDVVAIMREAPPDATIMSFGATQALVLSGQTNPSQHQNFHAGLDKYVEHVYPGGLDGFADFVEEEHPTFLAFDNPDAYPWLADVIERDYTRLGNLAGAVWYVDRDLGPGEITRLREEKKRLNDPTASAAITAVK
jgi:hypothetical protein